MRVSCTNRINWRSSQLTQLAMYHGQVVHLFRVQTMNPQELGAGSGRGGGRGPGGVSAAISRVMVGTLSLWLRAHEASANAVDTAVSCLDIGAWLAVCRDISSYSRRQLSTVPPHAAHVPGTVGYQLGWLCSLQRTCSLEHSRFVWLQTPSWRGTGSGLWSCRMPCTSMSPAAAAGTTGGKVITRLLHIQHSMHTACGSASISESHSNHAGLTASKLN